MAGRLCRRQRRASLLFQQIKGVEDLRDTGILSPIPIVHADPKQTISASFQFTLRNLAAILITLVTDDFDTIGTPLGIIRERKMYGNCRATLRFDFDSCARNRKFISFDCVTFFSVVRPSSVLATTSGLRL